MSMRITQGLLYSRALGDVLGHPSDPAAVVEDGVRGAEEVEEPLGLHVPLEVEHEAASPGQDVVSPVWLIRETVP